MVKKTLLWSALATTFAALTQSVLAESDVLSLDRTNFDKQVLHRDIMLVEFFAPWCGHCKALAPEYEVAATALKAKDIPLAKVDCTENGDLCQEYEVQGYPTLKVFRQGRPSDYQGGRKSGDIVSYMQKQAAPALTTLDSSNFDTFKTSDSVVVVGYVSPSDEESVVVLKRTAEQMRDDHLFGIVTDEALAKEHGITTFPSVVVYKEFDEGRNDLPGAFDQQAIQEFVTTSSIPLFAEIDGSNINTYLKAGLPLAYLFSDNKDTLKPLIEELKPVAQKYKGKINFVHIDANRYSNHAGNLALKEEWPAFAIQHVDTGAKFPFDQTNTITLANIEAFVDDYAAGKIAPTLKSEEPPADNNGPVKVVVGKEFRDIVLDTAKDVFLEVYAPWCGHCKHLAPTWTELGELVENQNLKDQLVIAKMDGTENDLPEDAGFTVRGFPTLKFFTAESNTIVDYNGGRSLEDFINFINEHGSKAYTLKSAEEAAAHDDTRDGGHDEL